MITYTPPVYHFEATHHGHTVHVAAPNTSTARIAAQHYFHTHKNLVLTAVRRAAK